MFFLFLINYAHTEYCNVAANHFVNMWFYGYDYITGTTTTSWKSEFSVRLKERLQPRNKSTAVKKPGNDPGYIHRKVGFLIEWLGFKRFLRIYECSRQVVIHKDAILLWSKISVLQIYEELINPPIVEIVKDVERRANFIQMISIVDDQVLVQGKVLYETTAIPIASEWTIWDAKFAYQRPLRVGVENVKDTTTALPKRKRKSTVELEDLDTAWKPSKNAKNSMMKPSRRKRRATPAAPERIQKDVDLEEYEHGTQDGSIQKDVDLEEYEHGTQDGSIQKDVDLEEYEHGTQDGSENLDDLDLNTLFSLLDSPQDTNPNRDPSADRDELSLSNDFVAEAMNNTLK